MNRENRMNTLKENNVDVTKYFTLIANDPIPAGTKFNVSIEMGNDPVAKQIIEDGYVRNSKLHRRWITAHYLRLLNNPNGWYRTMNRRYDYMYTIDMMVEEVRVLSKLERRDLETFYERKQFFTFKVINSVLDDYVNKLNQYINSLPIKKCKGKPYVRIRKIGDVFVDDLDTKIFNPIKVLVDICKKSYRYKDLYMSLVALKRVMVDLPYDTKKASIWIDAFQKEGVYYTFQNLLRFHDVKLYYNKTFYNMYEGLEVLNKLVKEQKGYQLNAMLKKTLEMNNFDFKKSIEAHK